MSLKMHKCIACNLHKKTSEFYLWRGELASRKKMCRSCESKDRKLRRKLIKENPLPNNHYCSICKRSDVNKWHLDHCHKTTKFRGWLCSTCNHGLGMFRDNTKTLTNAIKYLKRKEVTRSLSVTADNEEEAQAEACREWSSLVGGDADTAKVLLLIEENKDIIKTV